MSIQKTLKFTVDSALLQELGERLVGKPYIALAELVKNSYDADSNTVDINFHPNEEDYIEINDKGQGMTEDEFEKYWMKIGSTHKSGEQSRKFKRRMTGSKGVGRLAVQYLASEFEMTTVSDFDVTKKLTVKINWDDAIDVGGYLTDIQVHYWLFEDKNGFKKGTQIKLSGLKHPWGTDQVRGLAKEIWWLKPPFRTKFYTEEEKGKIFDINFNSSEREYVEVFNWQTKAINEIWYARIVGFNEKGKITISLEYPDENPLVYKHLIEDCEVESGEWELRIYYLYNRQPFGISVNDARSYLREFGGVYVYDGGFQLPFYGNPTNDWLKLQFDFSHRLSASELLPEAMRERGGMQFLPSLSRILGIVNISTAKEKELNITITRDRMNEDTPAFRHLVEMVRVGLDYYALTERQRRIQKSVEEAPIDKPKPRRILEVLDFYEDSIEPKDFPKIRRDIQKVTEDFESEAEAIAEQVSIIGPLATAGITTLAIEHEIKWQIKTLDSIIEQISEISADDEKNVLRKKINTLKSDLLAWSNRVRRQRTLFDYFKDTDNIKTKNRYSIKIIIEDTIDQVSVLARDVNFDTSQIEFGLLPTASLVEWSSIFQNIFLNAFNAMLDSRNKLISFKTIYDGENKELLIQDTGSGVDLSNSEDLFIPFVRKLDISPDMKQLEYGGSGLGLTIVRLIARNIGCTVSFIKPEKGFETAFSVKWSEKNG